MGWIKIKKPSHATVPLSLEKSPLKVPKREIFDRWDFHYFYTIKSLWEGRLKKKYVRWAQMLSGRDHHGGGGAI